MKLKTIEIEGKTYAEIKDGHPVYVDEGKDIAFDAPRAATKITELMTESKAHREAKESAESKLSKFDGITDPSEALKALDTVKNLDDKKLVDAGEVEKVKAAAISATEEKYAPVVEERDKLKTDLYKETIGGRFARSAYIQESLVIPSELVQAQFGDNFSLEEGVMTIKDNQGNPIYSKERAGELASFDEGLEILIGQYQHKDTILKGSESNGSGSEKSKGSSSGNQGDFGGDKAARVAAVQSKFPDLPAS
ncbi:MAG: hypothetical protein COB78_10895 [Hyphomicrobiales bacterium]|nr:MAG: hypothetical protein COB78_10895 [Hyphomicrobiales bacterium]